MSGLSKSGRRFAAVALLLLCVTVLGFVIAWPAVHYVKRQYAEQARLEERVARARARAAELPRIEAVAAEQTASRIWGRIYRDAELGGAGAEFERDVRAVLGPKFSGMPVERLAPISRGDLSELGVRLQIAATAADLADVLQRVESA